MEHGLLYQFRITGSPGHKRICKLFSTGLQGALRRKIVDWAVEWGQGATQMCGDQLLLAHENEAPLTSWDPSLIPKDRPYILAKGLKTLRIQDSVLTQSICISGQETLPATQPPCYHHHHRWDTVRIWLWWWGSGRNTKKTQPPTAGSGEPRTLAVSLLPSNR